MDLVAAIQQLKYPRDPYDKDLIAIRVVVLSLLEDKNEKPKPKTKLKKDDD